MLNQAQFFPPTSENLHTRDIVRAINLLTGLKEGDDSGFRKKCRVEECEEPIITIPGDHPGIVLRPRYDGLHEVDGKFEENLVVPGGLDHQMYGRESMVKGLIVAAEYLQKKYGSTVQLGILDTLRPCKRQLNLFSNALLYVLNGEKKPDLASFYQAGMQADGTSSWVYPGLDSRKDQKLRKEVEADLRATPNFFKEVQTIAINTKKSVEEVMEELITMCANVHGAGSNVEQKIDLPFSPDLALSSHQMGHSTGGCVDVFLMIDGKPVSSLVPFDYIGEEAGIEYYEDPKNFERFQKKALEDKAIQAYLTRLGIDYKNIPYERWLLTQQSVRVLLHTMMAVGFTYYSAHNPKEGGENWHFNGSNRVIQPRTGEIIHYGKAYEAHPNGGSACHARLRMPIEEDGKQIAIWGGNYAHHAVDVSM